MSSPLPDKSMMVLFNSSSPEPNLADILRIFLSRENKCSIVFISQAGGRSILLIAAIILPSLFLSIITLSSFVNGLLPSKIIITTSALVRLSQTRSIPSFSMTFCGSLIPAVSVRFTGMPLMLIVSVIKSRVVPGISVTIAFFLPVRVLIKLDFPTLGLPVMTTLIPSVYAFAVRYDDRSDWICSNAGSICGGNSGISSVNVSSVKSMAASSSASASITRERRYSISLLRDPFNWARPMA